MPAEALRGGIKPYSLTDHIHEREAGYQLSKLVPSDAPLSGDFKLAFAPHVAPWFQGIISTVSVPLSKEMRASDIRQLFEERYGDEQLVKVQSEVPEIYQIAGKHGVRLGGFQVHSSGKRVVVVVRPALSPSSFSAPVSRRADSLSTSVHPLARRASSTTSSRAPRPSACRTSTSRSALASSTASRSTSERAQLDVRRRSTRLGQDDVRQWQEAGRVVAEQGGTARRQSPRRRPGWRRRASHSSLSLSFGSNPCSNSLSRASPTGPCVVERGAWTPSSAATEPILGEIHCAVPARERPESENERPAATSELYGVVDDLAGRERAARSLASRRISSAASSSTLTG